MPRLIVENACYFVTSVVRNRACPLQGKAARSLQDTLFACRNRYGFALVGYCIMPDHFHALIAPSERNTISEVMRYIEGRFARLMNTMCGSDGSLWQEGFYETMIRDEGQLLKKLEYMHDNPVRRGLVASAAEFEHSSACHPEDSDLAAWLGLRGSPNLPTSR